MYSSCSGVAHGMFNANEVANEVVVEESESNNPLPRSVTPV